MNSGDHQQFINSNSFADSPCHIFQLHSNKEACHKVLLKLEHYLRHGVILL